MLALFNQDLCLYVCTLVCLYNIVEYDLILINSIYIKAEMFVYIEWFCGDNLILNIRSILRILVEFISKELGYFLQISRC